MCVKLLTSVIKCSTGLCQTKGLSSVLLDNPLTQSEQTFPHTRNFENLLHTCCKHRNYPFMTLAQVTCENLEVITTTLVVKALGDLKGAPGMHAPQGSKFFKFHVVLGRKLAK